MGTILRAVRDAGKHRARIERLHNRGGRGAACIENAFATKTR